MKRRKSRVEAAMDAKGKDSPAVSPKRGSAGSSPRASPGASLSAKSVDSAKMSPGKPFGEVVNYTVVYDAGVPIRKSIELDSMQMGLLLKGEAVQADSQQLESKHARGMRVRLCDGRGWVRACLFVYFFVWLLAFFLALYLVCGMALVISFILYIPLYL
jgi:hypothetical protein